MQNLAAEENNQSWLSWFFKGILALFFIILVARLFELQVIKGKYYRGLSEGNRIRRVRLAAPRGRILARGGEVLVGNKEVKKKIIFNEDGSILKTELGQGSEEDILISEWVRDYPLAEAFFHVSGFVGESTKDEVGKINPACPEKGPIVLGSFVGRGGLESYYECSLGGIDGEELIEVDTSGKIVRVLGRRDSIPGRDLKTSIKFDLQEKMPLFMNEQKGAIVVSDGQGEILSLFSYPSFNPNLIGRKEHQDLVKNALADQDLPMFNRAMAGIFHPGSVFKPIVAIAALSEGVIDKDFLYDDPGVITVNDYSYSNWYFTQYGKKEGEIDVIRAMARSTDTFFYKIGEYLGANKIAEWAYKFGLGKGTGIDLPGEVYGLIPSPSWKWKVKKENWFLGNTYHISIGQGDLAITPVELNAMTSALATDGELCDLKVADNPKCQNLKLERKNLDLVVEGMIEACSQGGTGFTFFDFEPRVAGKTGTAETNEDGKTHAWFTVFAPTDYPEIVVTVMIEEGGEGSYIAGPVAREIFDYWFYHTIPEREDITAND